MMFVLAHWRKRSRKSEDDNFDDDPKKKDADRRRVFPLSLFMWETRRIFSFASSSSIILKQEDFFGRSTFKVSVSEKKNSLSEVTMIEDLNIYTKRRKLSRMSPHKQSVHCSKFVLLVSGVCFAFNWKSGKNNRRENEQLARSTFAFRNAQDTINVNDLSLQFTIRTNPKREWGRSFFANLG